MTSYETLFIVRPDIDEDDLNKVVGRVEDVVKSNEGTIVESQVWGKKRLAYQVKEYTEGIYVKLNFDAPPVVVERLRDHFRLNEDVIRDIIVREERRQIEPAPVADESAAVAEDVPAQSTQTETAPVADESAAVAEDVAEQSTQTETAPVADESAAVAEDVAEQSTQTETVPVEDESAEGVRETEQLGGQEEVAEEGHTEHENREG